MGADMALVLWLLVALVPYLIGKGALRILYGSQTTQEMYPEDYVLTGGMIGIGLAEAAHLGAVMLGWSFSRCVNVFALEVAVAVLAAAAIVLACKRNARQNKGKKMWLSCNRLPWLLFVCVVVVQLIYVMTRRAVYVEGDMTLETVTGFLQTDAVYQVNPMTGKPYTLGLPLRLKILCLPTLYGILSRLFGISPESLVYGMVPGFVLLGSYLAYSTVARCLFPEKSCRRGVFMAATAILLGLGNYMYGMDGFGVMHAGFRGVTIRACILIPYVFGLMLRKKYKLVILCVLAEACIVWTLYGMGACLLIAGGIAVVQVAVDRYADRNSKEGRK